ncbi:MAG TPA: hypothetical protein VFL41_05685 [Gaiellaceae bacterium]|nr:hypothetical protein [Gaiellaceae bacterium]
MDTRGDLGTSSAWTGWVGFAAIMMVMIGMITSFEGIVAIARDEYFVVTGDQVIVFDLTTWGWIMLFWGAILFIAGIALAAKSGWARWFTIVVVTLNLLAQLGFLGNTQYPLWSLVIVSLEIVVLYALTVRWGQVEPA